MKQRLVFVLLMTLVAANLSGQTANPYAPATPTHLPTGRPACFRSDHLTGATYWLFHPDGRYSVLMREHMGVMDLHSGTWAPQTPGSTDLALTSTRLAADAGTPPLAVIAPRPPDFPCVRRAVRVLGKVLEGSRPGVVAPRLIATALSDDAISIEARSLLLEMDEPVTRDDLVAFRETLRRYLKDPELRRIRVVPLIYLGRAFLHLVNTGVGLEPGEVCGYIRDPQRAGPGLSAPFAIPPAVYTRETGSPYPFRLIPSMNAITGAEE